MASSHLARCELSKRLRRRRREKFRRRAHKKGQVASAPPSPSPPLIPTLRPFPRGVLGRKKIGKYSRRSKERGQCMLSLRWHSLSSSLYRCLCHWVLERKKVENGQGTVTWQGLETTSRLPQHHVLSWRRSTHFLGPSVV